MSNTPYIIAEMSGNHNGDIQRALTLIEKAKAAGADAVKLQTYTADTITIDHDGPGFVLEQGLWDKRKLYELYQEAHTPWEWHPTLFAKGRELGITVFSAPFDKTAVDFLESLDNPIYKIASFEIVDLPLIAYVAKTTKPMIISTGLASLEEIQQAAETAYANGCDDLTLLHCISAYPAPMSECNLRTIPNLKKCFPTAKIGLSDHTLGTTAAITAVSLGAEVIEKHFTLSREEGGVDCAFSLEPQELARLCHDTREAAEALGAVNYRHTNSESANLGLRRSLYVVQDIKAGETFTEENVRSIRPGLGLAPSFQSEILGKTAAKDIPFGTPMSLNLIADLVSSA